MIFDGWVDETPPYDSKADPQQFDEIHEHEDEDRPVEDENGGRYEASYEKDDHDGNEKYSGKKDGDYENELQGTDQDGADNAECSGKAKEAEPHITQSQKKDGIGAEINEAFRMHGIEKANKYGENVIWVKKEVKDGRKELATCCIEPASAKKGAPC